MLKNMSDVIVMTFCILLIFFITLFVYTGFGNSTQLNIYQEISQDEALVKELLKIISDNSIIRKPHYVNSLAENDDILKFIVSKANKNELLEYKVIPEKITCIVTDNVSFVSTNECHILKITNEEIMKYQLDMFNTNKVLLYNDFTYEGYECINDGYSYYCLVKEYKKEVTEHTYIDKIYIDGNKIVIMEYYYLSSDKELEHEFIKNNGVLYKHIFDGSSGKFFLEESIIIS